MSIRTLMTETEFDALPEREGFKVELSDGELVMTASPVIFHNRIRDFLAREIWTFAASRRLGEVTCETDFRLGSGVVRIPDVAFLSAERSNAIDIHHRPEGAPELVVEIVSPSVDADDLARKVRQYLSAGAQAVWGLYPVSELAYVYRPGQRPEVREATEGFDAPELLPGFSLPLARIFDWRGTPRGCATRPA